jgi:phosphoribosylformylglycinamidine synthase I
MKVAVLRFPGSNCEQEAMDALTQCDIPCAIVDWTSNESLDAYTGFLIPGGFSYQDRIRAGVIAAKLPLIQELKKTIHINKPILGICNGAQILLESGLMNNQLDSMIDQNLLGGQATGFVCDWGFLTAFNPTKNMFLSRFKENDALPIQICHGEGRFLCLKKPVSGLKYATIHGKISDQFPTTPNGSPHGFAAISNDSGNMLAIMPHPERSLSKQRYPLSIQLMADKHHLNLVNFTQLFKGFYPTC